MTSTGGGNPQQQLLQHQVAMAHIHSGAYSHHPHHQLPQHHHSAHAHNMAAVISQGNYISVPQMAVSSQAFSTQPGASTFVSMPMATVIQHRMASASQQGSAAHQRLGASPACAVSTSTNFATNFYIQTQHAIQHQHQFAVHMSSTTAAATSSASATAILEKMVYGLPIQLTTEKQVDVYS